MEAAHAATAGGRPGAGRPGSWHAAGALAERVDQPYASGMVDAGPGVSSYLEGRWPTRSRRATGPRPIFRDRCTGVAWELDTAHAFALWALSPPGRAGRAARRWPVLLNEARERGDLYAAMNLSTYIMSIVRLAADDPDAARDELRRDDGASGRARATTSSTTTRSGPRSRSSSTAATAPRPGTSSPATGPRWRGRCCCGSSSSVWRCGLRARCALAARRPGRTSAPPRRDAARLERERLALGRRPGPDDPRRPGRSPAATTRRSATSVSRPRFPRLRHGALCRGGRPPSR